MTSSSFASIARSGLVALIAVVAACSSSTTTDPNNGGNGGGGGNGDDGGTGTGGDSGTIDGTDGGGGGGDSGGTTTDAGGGGIDIGSVDWPQIASHGGPTLTAPTVVPIFFGTDASQTDITTFLTKLAGSQYWSTVTSEYGIGALKLGTAVKASASDMKATMTNDQIAALLSSKLDGNHAPFPKADPNTIYTLFVPATTTVTLFGDESCKAFGGYHYETTVGSTKVAYAVVPRCAGTQGLNQLQTLTVATSHEVAEAATDPNPVSAPAYNTLDANHVVWTLFPAPEVGDLCEAWSYVFTQPAEIGYTVQRLWSNKAAKGGHNPCVPTTSDPYFNAIPTLADSANITIYDIQQNPTTSMTKAVTLKTGESKTIDVTAYGENAPAQWIVEAVDVAAALDTTGKTKPEVSFKFAVPAQTTMGSVDAATVMSAGQKTQLTITRVADTDTTQGAPGGTVIALISQTGTSQADAKVFTWTGYAAQGQ